MSLDDIDWEDQRAFLAILENGSLSGAARKLGVAQPTARHRLEALERALGVILFTRSPAGLVPTAKAQALGAHARAMASASGAFVRAASAPPDVVEGTVRLSAAEMVGLEVLPPMLATLRLRHPRLCCELSLTNEVADVLGQEVDVAIRMQRPQQAALLAKRVGTVPLAFFAHRGFIERHGLPETLDELARLPLIGPDRSPADLAFAEALFGDVDLRTLALRTDSHPAQLAAIRAGIGVGVAHRAIGRRDPTLVAVLPDLVVHRFETWIVMHEDLKRIARVRAAFDHLVESFSRYADRD